MNKKVLLSLITGLLVLGISAVAFAADADPNVVAQTGAEKGKWIAIAAGFAIAIAAFGGAIGQGMTASKAVDGIARNPSAADKMFTPMILGLALIESLVIYALIIAILLQGKI